MCIYTILRCHKGKVKGVYYTDDFYDAQLVLHQVAEEYATQQCARALESSTSALKSDFMTQASSQLFYVVDKVASENRLYKKAVMCTPVVQTGILRECYGLGAAELAAEFHMIWTDYWDREYYNFQLWAEHHSVTVVTNGSDKMRQAAIPACLKECAVDADYTADTDCQLEKKPQPAEDETVPIVIALTESSGWEDVCQLVEPYSDMAITRIMEEQARWRDVGESLEDVVVILEASTPNMLSNRKVIELCESSNDLQMTVILSVAMNSKTNLPPAVTANIDYIFSLEPDVEGAFAAPDVFKEWPVYDLDTATYKVKRVATQW